MIRVDLWTKRQHGDAARTRCERPGGHTGSSLMEMLVWMAIVISISSVMYVILNRSSRLVRNGEDFLQSQGEMDMVLRRILRDARSARAVLSSHGNARSGTDTLILEVPAVDGSGSPIPGRFDTIIYENLHQQEKSIVRIVLPDTASNRTGGKHRLRANVSRVKFGYDSPDPGEAALVTVTVTATHVLADRMREIAVNGSALLRNRHLKRSRST